MKQWMFIGLSVLGLMGLGQSEAAAQGGPNCYPKGTCGPAGACCCSPCIDVYKPTWYIPQLRIPIFLPCPKLYCEPGPPKCGDTPWYAIYPQQQQQGYQIGAYGSFNGPVGLGAYSSYGTPMAAGSYYGPPGAQAQVRGPSYWYGR